MYTRELIIQAFVCLCLQENLKSPSAHVRGTVVTALKYTISDQPQPIDSLLHECIADFLSTIGDPDLVRKGLK